MAPLHLSVVDVKTLEWAVALVLCVLVAYGAVRAAVRDSASTIASLGSVVSGGLAGHERQCPAVCIPDRLPTARPRSLMGRVEPE